MSDYAQMMEKAVLYDKGAEGQLFVDALIAPGSATIVQPAYQHLTFTNINSGNAVINGDGDLVLNLTGIPATIEWRISATQNNNRHVFFGFAWDGGPITQGLQVITGQGASTPVFLIERVDLVGAATGDVLALYISSDYGNQVTAWTGGELMVIVS